MFRSTSSKLSLAVVAALGMSAAANAAPSLVYNLFTPRTDLTGDRQPGPLNSTPANQFIYDDINIASSNPALNTLNLANAGSGINVGLVREVGAPAVTVNISILRITGPDTNSDEMPEVDLTPVATFTKSLGAFSGGSAAFVPVWFTAANLVSGSLQIPLDYSTQAGQARFALGVSFDNADPTNTWAVHDYPNVFNANFNQDGAFDNSGNGYALVDGNNNDIYTTFAAQVVGEVVPEPATAGLALLGLGALATRRRRA
jgi:hypothetical protein